MNENLAETIKINSISLTAYRAIKILKLLLEKPCSANEILDCLKNDIITCRSVSDDTIRASLNSLKAIGCKISRPKPANDYKYSLDDHPFKLKLTRSQIRILKNVRKFLLNQNDWRKVLELNKLYDRIATILSDEESADLLNQGRPFVKIRPKILKYLENDALIKKEVVLLYATSVKNQKYIDIFVDSVFCENGKIYLWAYYPERQSFSYFNAEKICSIESVKTSKTVTDNSLYTAQYRLVGDDCYSFKPTEEERIVLKNNSSLIIEYKVKNEFKFFQRLLSFGADFELLSPDFAKKSLSEKIDKMFARYRDV